MDKGDRVRQQRDPQRPRAEHPDRRRHNTIFERLTPLGDGRGTILFWLAVSLAVIAGSALVSTTLESHADRYRAICVYLAVGFTSVPLAIQVGYTVFRNWAAQAGHFAYYRDPTIGDWLHAEFGFIRGERGMVAAGASMGIIAVIAFVYGGYFEEYPHYPSLWLGGVMFGSAGFAGMGLYTMYCASRTFWRMGQLEQLELVVHEHRFGVLSIGSALFRCWLMIGVVWAIYTATAYVGYTGENPDVIIQLPPMWILAIPTLPFIVGSFVVCQIPLHRKMLAYKREQIQRVDRMLAELSPASVDEMDSERRSKIDFLEKRKLQIRSLPDWPFNRASLLGTGASSLTAILPVVTNYLPKWVGDLFKVVT